MSQETLHENDIIEDLQADALSAEDQEVLKQWDREEAVKSIGQAAMPELVQRQDGTVTTAEAVNRERAEGQGDSGPYGNGSRA